MQPTTPALSIRGLHKAFGTKVSVDRVSLDVPAGSFYGIAGPNGAGKTTLLSMAVGLLRPDAGTSAVLGADVWRHGLQARRDMGVLPDSLALPEFLTGREVLTFMGRLRGLAPPVVDERAQELLGVMDLLGEERTLVVDYSTGMRKKISLAIALLHNPRLLVLDEPFEAVDPVSSLVLRSILTRYVARGGAVVLSSHVMPLLEQLCDSVAVISQGRLVASGPLDEIRGTATLEEAFTGLVENSVDDSDGLPWLGS